MRNVKIIPRYILTPVCVLSVNHLLFFKTIQFVGSALDFKMNAPYLWYGILHATDVSGHSMSIQRMSVLVAEIGVNMGSSLSLWVIFFLIPGRIWSLLFPSLISLLTGAWSRPDTDFTPPPPPSYTQSPPPLNMCRISILFID